MNLSDPWTPTSTSAVFDLAEFAKVLQTKCRLSTAHDKMSFRLLQSGGGFAPCLAGKEQSFHNEGRGDRTAPKQSISKLKDGIFE